MYVHNGCTVPTEAGRNHWILGRRQEQQVQLPLSNLTNS